jgi:hypothetical protein
MVVINNPCLEYWYLLHFKQTSKYYSKYSEFENVLKKHIKGYEKSERFYKKCNNDIYSKLKPNLKSAIKNSKLKTFDFSNTKTGTSGMHKFFDEAGIS